VIGRPGLLKMFSDQSEPKCIRFGTYGVDEAIKAGLDLEMPGPPRWRTPLLINHLLTCQKLDVPIIEERATKLLSFVQKVARASPEVVYGDGVERTRDSPESRAFNRKVAAEGMVLLKNRDGLLPLSAPKKIAVIGPNAKGRVISGGGSAFLRASYIVTPWAGIENAASKETEVHYTVGCYGKFSSPSLSAMDSDSP
jgi:beta-glucosidase